MIIINYKAHFHIFKSDSLNKLLMSLEYIYILSFLFKEKIKRKAYRNYD